MTNKEDSAKAADPLQELVVSMQSILPKFSFALEPAEQERLRQELLALSPEARLRYALVAAKQRGLLPPDMTLEMLRHQIDLNQTHGRILKAHRAPVIKSPLHIWWARQSCVAGVAPTDWSQHTEAGTDEEIIDGDHYTFIQPPNSEKLVERLKQRLELIRNAAINPGADSLSLAVQSRQ